MSTRLLHYLGRPIGELLANLPFSGWRVVRSVESEPRLEVRYEFGEHGLEVICNESDRIQTVFVRRGDAEILVDAPFAMKRQEVLERFGEPTKSGSPVRIPGLGDRGAWDRFRLAGGTLHVAYRPDRDEIDMITLMCPEAVP